MLKVIYSSLFAVLFIYCQSETEKKLFHPGSDYLQYGIYKVNFYSTSHKTGSFLQRTGITKYNFRLIPYRTVAVDPENILIGSVLFIPRAVGIPLTDGYCHDGYFLAHDMHTASGQKKIDIYTGYDAGGNNPFIDRKQILPDSDIEVFLVRGTMEKVINTQYEHQYQSKKTQRTFQMTWKDMERMMQEAQQKYKNVSRRIEYISDLGKGTPYVMFHLGEGPGAAIDPDPLIEIGRTDCMTFCEHVLAAAISINYNQMFKNLQKIRYKDSKINYASRNHFTIADWLPNNRWLLFDATEDIGGKYCQSISKIINRKELLLKAGLLEKDIDDITPVQNITRKYIPAADLIKIMSNLKGGEIASIVTNKPGLFSVHMGIIVRDEWNNIIFRHASSRDMNMQVIDQRFEEIVDSINKSGTRIGMIFMRAREDVF
jgi:3D (Asp-Asp-Asp) domain-containing protein